MVNNVRIRHEVFVWSRDVDELEQRIEAADKLAERRESAQTLVE
jgi:hypothetical protein